MTPGAGPAPVGPQARPQARRSVRRCWGSCRQFQGQLLFVDGDAVIDGQMVSARAWPDHPTWMREFIEILRSKSPA